MSSNGVLLRVDSEREEGEIVDELDDLSDISSEEEYLLRQRLQVLENYNNVLGRKEARSSSVGSGSPVVKDADPQSFDLSDISLTKFKDRLGFKDIKKTISAKPVKHKQTKIEHNRHNRKKDSITHERKNTTRPKDQRKKIHRAKKRQDTKNVGESSDDDLDYEFRNKRRKLADAVLVKKDKTDTSLKDRIMKMIGGAQNHLEDKLANDKNVDCVTSENKNVKTKNSDGEDNLSDVEISKTNEVNIPSQINLESVSEFLKRDEKDIASSVIEIVSTDESVLNETNRVEVEILADSEQKDEQNTVSEGSDDDLEVLRQFALKTKTSKSQVTPPVSVVVTSKSTDMFENEDSDTAELRLICLRSALLKKAIERKQKQKLRKRLSQSLLDDDIFHIDPISDKNSEENNTDIESVDMDMGSDGPDMNEDRNKDTVDVFFEPRNTCSTNKTELKLNISSEKNHNLVHKEEEIEEDEDLLRAKLLTSLSKKLPHLVDVNNLSETIEEIVTEKKVESVVKAKVANLPDKKRFIINTADSESDGEHEATKNLTKMHLKLSEQPDFQQKLDLFLKSTRMKVENGKLADVKDSSPIKFVPKTVNHLPKSEQIEYKNLVKRMAELEKIKEARLVANVENKVYPKAAKDTLKPRNVTIEANVKLPLYNLEDQIALSRKKIAEESAKVLKLRDEATKLLQRYKIVATELNNLSTAITFNKRQQKSSQIMLSKIRTQHQMLLKRSSLQSNIYPPSRFTRNVSSKLQKENEPLKENYKNSPEFKSVRVSVVNDLKEQEINGLSVQIDVASNRKTVKNTGDDMIKSCSTFDTSSTKESDTLQDTRNIIEDNIGLSKNIVDEAATDRERARISDKIDETRMSQVDDYQSPLQALVSTNWNGDPNGVLCPFEVCGSCKDANCKYLHPPKH